MDKPTNYKAKRKDYRPRFRLLYLIADGDSFFIYRGPSLPVTPDDNPLNHARRPKLTRPISPSDLHVPPRRPSNFRIKVDRLVSSEINMPRSVNILAIYLDDSALSIVRRCMSCSRIFLPQSKWFSLTSELLIIRRRTDSVVNNGRISRWLVTPTHPSSQHPRYGCHSIDCESEDIHFDRS